MFIKDKNWTLHKQTIFILWIESSGDFNFITFIILGSINNNLFICSSKIGEYSFKVTEYSIIKLIKFDIKTINLSEGNSTKIFFVWYKYIIVCLSDIITFSKIEYSFISSSILFSSFSKWNKGRNILSWKSVQKLSPNNWRNCKINFVL